MDESLLGEFCQKDWERLYPEDASTVRVVSEKIHESDSNIESGGYLKRPQSSGEQVPELSPSLVKHPHGRYCDLLFHRFERSYRH